MLTQERYAVSTIYNKHIQIIDFVSLNDGSWLLKKNLYIRIHGYIVSLGISETIHYSSSNLSQR